MKTRFTKRSGYSGTGCGVGSKGTDGRFGVDISSLAKNPIQG